MLFKYFLSVSCLSGILWTQSYKQFITNLGTFQTLFTPSLFYWTELNTFVQLNSTWLAHYFFCGLIIYLLILTCLKLLIKIYELCYAKFLLPNFYKSTNLQTIFPLTLSKYSFNLITFQLFKLLPKSIFKSCFKF